MATPAKTKPHPGICEIATRFKQYNSDLSEIWEDYLFLDFYLPHFHEKIKRGVVPEMPYESLYSKKRVPFTKKYIYGVIDRIKKTQVPVRAFLQAVALTENYLQSMTFRIYKDFPYKLETKDENVDQQFKIIAMIVESINRDEIIERLSEEKIRGIFYGKPVDFFKTDKARIGIDGYVRSTYNLALEKFDEIMSRRNIYTHNHGKVDRKYLREIKGTSYKLDEKPIITKDYLKESILVLLGLSAVTTEIVLRKSYGAPDVSQRLKTRKNVFDSDYKGK